MFKLCCAALVGSLASEDAGEYTAATHLALAVFDANDADSDEDEAAVAAAGRSPGGPVYMTPSLHDLLHPMQHQPAASAYGRHSSRRRSGGRPAGAGKPGALQSVDESAAMGTAGAPPVPPLDAGTTQQTTTSGSAITFGVDKFRDSDVARGLRSIVPIITRRATKGSAEIRQESVTTLRCLCRWHLAALRPATEHLTRCVRVAAG